MDKKDLINYLSSNSWCRRWRDDNDDEWEYERSYADFIYDNLYIDVDKVNLCSNKKNPIQNN
jgi:hypothetical protein